MRLLLIIFFNTFISYNLYTNAVYASTTVIVPQNIKDNKYFSFADIVEPLIPAIVNIYTIRHVNVADRPTNGIIPFERFNDLFQQFGFPFNSEMQKDQEVISLGSGFIIDTNGFIVTNHHVVNNADEINVRLTDNTELPAKLIGSDQKTDIALLKVDTKNNLPFVKFGNSDKARVGDWVIAIGNPLGFTGTVTTGIISSKSRDLDTHSDGIVDDFLQTDAAINSGNSGGPMFNLEGEVIGVNTAIVTPSGVNIGIGFAIPSNTTQHIVKQLKQYGKVKRGALGVTIQDVTTELAEGLGLKDPYGALVIDVQHASCAEKAGLKSGDVIIEFDNQKVKNLRKLQVLVAETTLNKSVKIAFIRDNKHHEVSCVITQNDTMNVQSASGSIENNGITFSNLTQDLRGKFDISNYDNGVIITNIVKDQQNQRLMIGDLVIAVNYSNVENIDQIQTIFNNVKAANKKHAVLFIKRRNVHIFIAIPIHEHK